MLQAESGLVVLAAAVLLVLVVAERLQAVAVQVGLAVPSPFDLVDLVVLLASVVVLPLHVRVVFRRTVGGRDLGERPLP